MAANDKNKPKGITKAVIDLGNFLGDTSYNLKKPGAIQTGLFNAYDTIDRFLLSKGDAAPGQGRGDLYAAQVTKDLGKFYPRQYAADIASKSAQMRPATGGSVMDSYVKVLANPVVDGAAGAKASAAGGAVTPASIASQMTSKVGAQRAAEMAAAKAAGVAYVPGQAMGTAAKMAQDAQAKAETDALNESNMAIESTYNPVLEFLKKQQDQTSARYAQNSANLKNIFGALTGLSAKDQANVKAQFESSLTKQADDLATRTAEQRAAQAAGAAQAAVTGAERGTGPALQGSPTATATEEAIGQSNAIQTNWEGLMGAQESNALTDIMNRDAGYGQQEVAATNQMAQNLQDALMGIEGQQANIQSQIAQAKVARDQAIANNEADAAAAANKVLGELRLQELKNQGQMDVATLKANATLAAKRLSGGGSGAAPKVPASEQIKARADLLGPTVFQQIQASAGDAYNQAFATLNPNADAPGAKIKTPSAADVKAAWQAAHRGKATSVAPLANDYIDSAYN